MLMTKLPANIVKCSACGRYYGYAWEAERPGARRAAILTGWLQVAGHWYCCTRPSCYPQPPVNYQEPPAKPAGV